VRSSVLVYASPDMWEGEIAVRLGVVRWRYLA
jgi:hypothetical protein